MNWKGWGRKRLWHDLEVSYVSGSFLGRLNRPVKVPVSKSSFEIGTPGIRIMSAAHSIVFRHQCCVLGQLTEHSTQSCYVQLLVFVPGPSAIGLLTWPCHFMTGKEPKSERFLLCVGRREVGGGGSKATYLQCLASKYISLTLESTLVTERTACWLSKNT